jgi:Flp pilus assembly pilin Flp
MRRGRERERGSATVEQAGLVTLVALVAIAAVAAVAAGGDVDSGRDLARAIGRKIVCAPRLPDGCRHHPLVPAYGWPLARLARALAPIPEPLPGPGGLPLAPVDFRRCRSEGCAARGRPTLFTEIDDRRADLGWVELTYWMYRPTIGWARVVRRASEADVEAASGTRVLLKDDPMLVPLETLPGRDHYDFPAGERPPWQWHLRGIHNGWSS